MSLGLIPRSRDGGFTLAELLVAIAIFSVLSVFAYQGLRNFLTARAIVESRNDGFLRMTKCFSLLQHDLESLVARPVRDELGDALPAVEGNPNTEALLALTRHTPWAPMARPGTDLKRIEYYFKGENLIRRTWNVLDRLPDSSYFEQALIDGVAAVDFRFYDQTEWVEEWPRARGVGDLARLPGAISVEITFANGRAIKRIFLVSGAG